MSQNMSSILEIYYFSSALSNVPNYMSPEPPALPAKIRLGCKGSPETNTKLI